MITKALYVDRVYQSWACYREVWKTEEYEEMKKNMHMQEEQEEVWCLNEVIFQHYRVLKHPICPAQVLLHDFEVQKLLKIVKRCPCPYPNPCFCFVFLFSRLKNHVFPCSEDAKAPQVFRIAHNHPVERPALQSPSVKPMSKKCWSSEPAEMVFCSKHPTPKLASDHLQKALLKLNTL